MVTDAVHCSLTMSEGPLVMYHNAALSLSGTACMLSSGYTCT